MHTSLRKDNTGKMSANYDMLKEERHAHPVIYTYATSISKY